MYLCCCFVVVNAFIEFNVILELWVISVQHHYQSSRHWFRCETTFRSHQASHLTGMSLQTLTPPCSVTWYGYQSFFRSYPSSLLFPFLFPSLLATHLPLKYLITCNGNIPLITLCKWASLLHTIKMKTPNINYIIKESCLMCQRLKKKQACFICVVINPLISYKVCWKRAVWNLCFAARVLKSTRLEWMYTHVDVTNKVKANNICMLKWTLVVCSFPL